MSTNRLRVGERLNFGDSLVSQNGQHILTFQKDGNLVLYRKGQAEWHTNTANRPHASGSAFAGVEADGNFVVGHKFWGYRWESMSNHYGAQSPYLVVENDGMISVYDEKVYGRHWSSDDFPNEITGLFEEYALSKRFLEKFRNDADRSKAANEKFQALRQWLEVLRATRCVPDVPSPLYQALASGSLLVTDDVAKSTDHVCRGVSVKKIMKRATWTQDHARDLGLITVVNRMQKIKDRINVEADAIRVVRKLAPCRLKYLQPQQNGDSRELNEKRQLFKVVRGLIKERERRRIEQRRIWLSNRAGKSPGAKFGFEHDDEFDDDDSRNGYEGYENYEKGGKVPDRLRHSIDFLLLTIHEVVEFESLTATAECNRALALLFQLYVKGNYKPDYTTFDVCDVDPIELRERTSLGYWKFGEEGFAAVVTYGLSEDKNWFGDCKTRLDSVVD